MNALALGLAVWLFDGITLTGGSDTERFLKLLVVGAIFGLITAFVRPIVNLISLPLIVLTLGLMLLVVNALMLMLTSAISGGLNLGFHVDGFWTALWGSIIISIASMVLEAILPSGESPMSLPEPTGSPYRIAFVCLGNICRSPMANVILTELVDRAGLADKVEVASCGTGDWHVGEPMDPVRRPSCRSAGYDASAHRAQTFDPTWLENDLVLAMDAKNLAEITNGRGGRRPRADVPLLRPTRRPGRPRRARPLLRRGRELRRGARHRRAHLPADPRPSSRPWTL